MTTPLENEIEANVQKPQSVTVDNLNIQQQTIQNQIAADRYLASARAIRSKKFLLITQIIPPGTT